MASKGCPSGGADKPDSGDEDRSSVSTVAQMIAIACKTKLSHRMFMADMPIERYLDKLVPSSAPYSTAGISPDPSAFSRYEPSKRHEVRMHRHLCAGFTALVSSFDEHCRPSFWSSKYMPLTSPFVDGPSRTSCQGLPQISVYFPGVPCDEDGPFDHEWDTISMAVELHDSASKDPFIRTEGQRTAHDWEILERLIWVSRTLLLHHGFLFTFALGVFGDILRIVRLDRTAAVVSRPCNIRTEAHLVQQFFWHFTHPVVGSPVVGCDPTLRRLTLPEQKWLQKQLDRLKRAHKPSPRDRYYARRVEVHDDRDGSVTAYFRYKLVDAESQYGTRTTAVWSAIEDRYEQDPNADQEVKPRILKEMWRSLMHQPETVFYRRLARTINVNERCGLPTFLHGGDLGQSELRLLETAGDAYATDLLSDEGAMRLHTLEPPPSPPPTRETPCGEAPSPSIPQHQTCSWAIFFDCELTGMEVSHVRFAIEEVGRCLTDFKDTRELVIAMRDAIRGHKLAWEKAGILHRDVSIGNILIVDEPTPEGQTGFLHDFDASFISEYAPGDTIPCSVDPEAIQAARDEALKMRRGTFFFTALALLGKAGVGVIHKVAHDLESFYWALLYVVLRHTVHSLGQKKCKEIFYDCHYACKDENVRIAVARKLRWLNAPVEDTANVLVIDENAPLTRLMHKFKSLVQAVNAEKSEGENVLTYANVLRLFDEAIESPEWPTQDRINCYLSGPMGHFRNRQLTKSASELIKGGVKRDYASLARYPSPVESYSVVRGYYRLRRDPGMKKRRKLASMTREMELKWI